MNHHWEGLVPNPDKYFGFVYQITNTETGRFYIGKRQYWVSNRKVKKASLRPNKTEGVWNAKHWKLSKWEYYTSSSQELNEDIKKNPTEFIFTIVGQYICKADLTYAECKFQMDMDVMTERDSEQNRLSYNKQVAAVKYIPPCLDKEELNG